MEFNWMDFNSIEWQTDKSSYQTKLVNDINNNVY